MSKPAPRNQPTKNSSAPVSGFAFVRSDDGFTEYVLKKNGLRVLYKQFPGTGVVTTNITYLAGATDEARGETGLAHMLEHMLFKPTSHDRKRKVDSGAMQFEREIGCVLNANTNKDRTTYFFSYPAEHLSRAVSIEAERMHDVLLTDAEFQPERSNVLSEFDMYFGEPEFALNVAMIGAAFQSSEYGHETIGFREDIEDYTVEKLQRFYRTYYRPDNALLMIFGDVSEAAALKAVKAPFGTIAPPPKEVIPRIHAREPKQEGKRTITIKRESSTNLLAMGVYHEGFPSREWYEAHVALDVLAGGPESVLHKLLVDTGKAVKLEPMLEPTAGRNLGMLFITLSGAVSHEAVEAEVLKTIAALSTTEVAPLVKKAVAQETTDRLFEQSSSLKTAMSVTEHVAVGDWSTYANEIQTLQQITARQVVARCRALFADTQLVNGYFIGTTQPKQY